MTQAEEIVHNLEDLQAILGYASESLEKYIEYVKAGGQVSRSALLLILQIWAMVCWRQRRDNSIRDRLDALNTFYRYDKETK